MQVVERRNKERIMKTYVLKTSGKEQKFDPRRIYSSVIDAGGSEKLARGAMKEVETKYVEGMTTEQILEIVLEYLKKEPGISERYNLKRAIMSLGPSGFPFEMFFARLLDYYGYDTKVGVELQGKKKIYEIDIVAKKKEMKYLIECKYHNHPGIVTKLRHAHQVHERFLELKKHKFNRFWLATNTSCPPTVMEYSKQNNMKLTTWKYPEKESLRDLIENNQLYPITILTYLPEETKQKLYSAEILIAKDLLEIGVEGLIKKGLSKKESKLVMQNVQQILK